MGLYTFDSFAVEARSLIQYHIYHGVDVGDVETVLLLFIDVDCRLRHDGNPQVMKKKSFRYLTTTFLPL